MDSPSSEKNLDQSLPCDNGPGIGGPKSEIISAKWARRRYSWYSESIPWNKLTPNMSVHTWINHELWINLVQSLTH